jgi:hypothetical protein
MVSHFYGIAQTVHEPGNCRESWHYFDPIVQREGMVIVPPTVCISELIQTTTVS